MRSITFVPDHHVSALPTPPSNPSHSQLPSLIPATKPTHLLVSRVSSDSQAAGSSSGSHMGLVAQFHTAWKPRPLCEARPLRMVPTSCGSGMMVRRKAHVRHDMWCAASSRMHMPTALVARYSVSQTQPLPQLRVRVCATSTHLQGHRRVLGEGQQVGDEELITRVGQRCQQPVAVIGPARLWTDGQQECAPQAMSEHEYTQAAGMMQQCLSLPLAPVFVESKHGW